MSEENQVEGEELPHLLLVDDDATFTRVMARAMSRRGFRVSTASSAEEGLILAQQDLPDYATFSVSGTCSVIGTPLRPRSRSGGEARAGTRRAR